MRLLGRLCPKVARGFRVPWGLSRFSLVGWADQVRGLRLKLPGVPVWREGYNVEQDTQEVGWWVPVLGLTLELRPAYGCGFNVGFRCNWGFAPPRNPLSVRWQP